MSGPVNDPPPPGPGKPKDRPLDPNSPAGRAAADRLTLVLAELRIELAAADRERQVRAA